MQEHKGPDVGFRAREEFGDEGGREPALAGVGYAEVDVCA